MAAVLAASTLVTPQLTGPFAVGTVDAHLTDSTRADPWQPTKNRELMLTVSYPARRGGQQAPWLGATLATALDPIISSPAYLGIPAGTVDWSGTRRQARDARPLPGKWPVVLFSPGLQSPREFYAGAADDLASRGYVVVTVSHTHETVAVEFPGDRIEWGLMQDASQATMKKAIDARIADMRFVLNELPKLHNGADVTRVGVAGHSYGGYTAAETMANDSRFDAGINIDGAMEHTGDDGPYAPGKAVTQGLDRPFLLFGGDLGERELTHVDTSLTRTWADFWPHQRGWKRDVHLDDGAHLGFSDIQWSVPQIDTVPTERRESLIGTIDPTASLKAQHDYVAAFFDLHLKHRGTRLFERARHEGIRLVP
ncbi:prolyl oligopeptidase family serine peptidase [Lentzea sp. NPDC034063]|uniref:alpha/beta hydrolase family protein n=1 Tax=unclassified Lentzea TaxID=2643253 RepID=UPI0034060A51